MADFNTHTQTHTKTYWIQKASTQFTLKSKLFMRQSIEKNSNLCIFIRRVALNSTFILLFSSSFHASISIWWFLGRCHTRLNGFYQCFPIVWSQVNQITDAISWELLCSIFQKLCFIRAHLSGVHLPVFAFRYAFSWFSIFLHFAKSKKYGRKKNNKIPANSDSIRFDSIPCIGINCWLIPIKCVLFGYSLISNCSSFRFDFVLIR